MADKKITATENSTHYIDFEIKDEADVNLSSANIASMFMTIYHRGATDTVITARTDVRNAGAWDQGVTVPTAGTLTIHLTVAQNAIVSTNVTNGLEPHSILIEGTTAGTPSETFVREFIYYVQEINRIPAV